MKKLVMYSNENKVERIFQISDTETVYKLRPLIIGACRLPLDDPARLFDVCEWVGGYPFCGFIGLQLMVAKLPRDGVSVVVHKPLLAPEDEVCIDLGDGGLGHIVLRSASGYVRITGFGDRTVAAVLTDSRVIGASGASGTNVMQHVSRMLLFGNVVITDRQRLTDCAIAHFDYAVLNLSDTAFPELPVPESCTVELCSAYGTACRIRMQITPGSVTYRQALTAQIAKCRKRKSLSSLFRGLTAEEVLTTIIERRDRKAVCFIDDNMREAFMDSPVLRGFRYYLDTSIAQDIRDRKRRQAASTK